jgi:hypothetical protein
MYREIRKNWENNAAPTSSPTRLAALRVRSRKMRSGMIGVRVRSSIARNEASSTAEATSSPTVRPLPQPRVAASVMA